MRSGARAALDPRVCQVSLLYSEFVEGGARSGLPLPAPLLPPLPSLLLPVPVSLLYRQYGHQVPGRDCLPHSRSARPSPPPSLLLPLPVSLLYRTESNVYKAERTHPSQRVACGRVYSRDTGRGTSREGGEGERVADTDSPQPPLPLDVPAGPSGADRGAAPAARSPCAPPSARGSSRIARRSSDGPSPAGFWGGGGGTQSTVGRRVGATVGRGGGVWVELM